MTDKFDAFHTCLQGERLRPHQADFVIGSYRGDEAQVVDSCARALEDMVSVLKATSS